MPNSQFIGTELTGQLEGLQAPHYSNGRLLTAEDLQADQKAVLTRQSWLGKACGYGVIEGLLVSRAGPTSITITAGLGLNRLGETIRLSSDPTLPLVPQVTNSQLPPDAGRFTCCDFQSTGPTHSVQTGAYLLTAVPASHFSGLAPMKAAAGSISNGNASNTPGCGSKWEVESVEFKIIRLTGFDAQGDGVTDSNRRNLLAHWCYGSQRLPDLPLDPFHFSANFGGLDQLDPTDLTPCALPLAVFYWTGTKLDFVDLWSARRRLIHPDPLDEAQEIARTGLSFSLSGVFLRRSESIFQSVSGSGSITPPDRVTQPKTRTWKGLMSDKRVADAQARFLQFQEQIQKFMDDGTAGAVVAADYFRFFPPVSFLPITLDWLRRITSFTEFDRLEAGTPASTWWRHLFVSELREAPVGAPPEAESQQTVPFLSYLRFILGKRAELEKQANGNLVNHGTTGFNIETFFSGFLNVNLNIGLVDSETVDFTLQQSWYDEAIDLKPILSIPDRQGGSLAFFERPYVNLYLIAENLESPYDQPYLMIVKGRRPTIWASSRQQTGRIFQ